MIHDLRIAFTIWGFLDPAPAAELVAERITVFDRLADPHHYDEVRALVDSIPEATLRMSPAEVNEIYSVSWKHLLGVT